MARLLVSKVLSIVKDKDAYQWSKVKMLHLVCDCGPHFRSREGFAFFLHDLVKDWKVNVTLHFLGEQHGKGPVDRLFGWTCAWIEAFLQDRPIYGLQDLLACYRAGAQEMVNTDPPRPKFHIAKFDPGVTRPETRTYFQCPNLLITRTYCLKAVATPRSIRLTNNVFSDAQGEEIGNWEIEPRTMNEDDVESKTWRRTFWSGEKSWESTGPKPGEVNELVRRFSSQKHLEPPTPPEANDSVDLLLSKAAARLQNAALKKKRQAKALH
ncbi:unnamed protein product, partial [Durusdinium trenchii]